ncbi:PRC-barrel domain-containing protein [Bradyrhizobium genosp. P]|uniref:PRC-barrel domain-containing protein n=1 Tax=Bradyrhizobium genosp. P TaxID=83641 RepID=UPI003CEC1523
MIAFKLFQHSNCEHGAASAVPSRRDPPSSINMLVWLSLAVMLAFTTSPALPQAGVTLLQVDLSVVGQGYRMSKLLGSGVVNDKSEKIGTLDDVISDKKQLNFAILQVGGFLGLGGRLVAVPYDSLVIDDKGQKVTLPGASKEALKNLTEFHYTS